MEGFRSRCRITEFPTEVVNVGFLGRGNEGIRGGLAKLHPRVLSRRATFLDPCRVNSPILNEGGFDFRGDPGGIPVVNRGHFVGNRGMHDVKEEGLARRSVGKGKNDFLSVERDFHHN